MFANTSSHSRAESYRSLKTHVLRCIRHSRHKLRQALLEGYLFSLYCRKRFSRSPQPYRERIHGYSLQVTDSDNFYIQYKDEFIRHIYHFKPMRPDPLIIDGGSNIGMSILYFKHTYPLARITGFEPDPMIFKLLQENVSSNQLQNITLINAGLSATRGQRTFIPDDSSGGHIGNGEKSISVRMEQLSDYLTEPVDFLKLNIEGEEFSVLQESAARGRLKNIREMVIEYHGWPNAKQRLGDILVLLDEQGFRYLVHDFDSETCGTSKPPFHITEKTTWFCLIYARKMENGSILS